jgi:O-6-methylguanine DNA methyltransferase
MASQIPSVATVTGPRGPVHLAAIESGLVALDLVASMDEFLAQLMRRFGNQPPAEMASDGTEPRPDRIIAHITAAEAAVKRYLQGEPDAFDALTIDLSDRPRWDREVLAAVRTIRRGQTASYGDIARAIGHPGAARAVGGAVARNPVSLVIPCHRVIAGDGTLGGYGGGWWGSREDRLALKRDLLAREGAAVPDRGSTGITAR